MSMCLWFPSYITFSRWWITSWFCLFSLLFCDPGPHSSTVIVRHTRRSSHSLFLFPMHIPFSDVTLKRHRAWENGAAEVFHRFSISRSTRERTHTRTHLQYGAVQLKTVIDFRIITHISSLWSISDWIGFDLLLLADFLWLTCLLSDKINIWPEK